MKPSRFLAAIFSLLPSSPSSPSSIKFVLMSLLICFSVRHQTPSTFTASRAASSVSSSPPAACLHRVLHKKVSQLKLLYTEDAQITKNSSQLLTLLTHYSQEPVKQHKSPLILTPHQSDRRRAERRLHYWTIKASSRPLGLYSTHSALTRRWSSSGANFTKCTHRC